jgi:hypothetical protein
VRTYCLAFVLVAAPLILKGQSSPDQAKDLYTRGLNALTGSVQSATPLDGVDLIRQSAKLGYGPALTSMGYIQEMGVAIASDPQEAAPWYQAAAEQGDTLAAWSLGRLFSIGAIADARQGEKWLKQAADAGDPFGAYLFAEAIFPRDRTTAAKYYKQAAEQGLPFAQFRLGTALREGLGVPLDKDAAYMWLLVSHRAGVSEAATAMQQLEGELG